MLKKIPVCFTLKFENIQMLKNNKGIATSSAYLDYVIEQYFLKNGCIQGNFLSLEFIKKNNASVDTLAIQQNPPTFNGASHYEK